MALRVETVDKVSVTTTAKDVDINYRAFMIENLTDGETVYFKEKSEDGKACTSNNGFGINGVKIFDKVMRAKTLSVIGSGSCDARIIYFTEED